MWRSQRFRLRVAFVAAAIVAVVVTTAQATARARDALLDEHRETLAALAATWQTAIDKTIETSRRHLITIAGDITAMNHVFRPTAATPSPAFHAQLVAKLERIRSTFGYDDVVFVDDDGRVLRAGGAGSLDEPLRAVVARARRAVEPTIVDATASGLFVVGAAVRSGDDVIGTLLLLLSPANLAPPQAAPDVHLSLVDERDVVHVGAGAPPGADVLRVEEPLSVDGRTFRVVVEEDREALLDPLCRLEQRLSAIGLVVAVVVAVVGVWLARRMTRPALALAAVARDVGQRVADPDVDAAMERARAGCADDEIGELADALRQMVRDLRATTVSRDALDAAHGELRRLNARLIDAQEDERARIARELHDDVVQRLASLAIELGRVKKIADDEVRRLGLRALKERLAALAEDVNGISRRLHPSTLHELGLDVAIVGECRGFFERGGPPVDVEVPGDWSGVAGSTCLALFRVVQESLRNVARHANASHVRVHLRRDADSVVLVVHDDGRGFARDADDFHPGLGLSSMAERVRLLGGVFSVVSSPGQGTTIHAEIPA